jgi:hydroxymethylpyrimidine pyrophosphatase-like HAD family hydrolase
MNEKTYYMNRKRLIVQVDFDDTITDDSECFPEIGKIRPNVSEVMNRLSKKGVRFILFSARDNKNLAIVKDFIKEHNLPIETINKNVVDAKYRTRKLCHDINIDDRSLDVNLDWLVIEKKIENIINGGFHREVN